MEIFSSPFTEPTSYWVEPRGWCANFHIIPLVQVTYPFHSNRSAFHMIEVRRQSPRTPHSHAAVQQLTLLSTGNGKLLLRVLRNHQPVWPERPCSQWSSSVQAASAPSRHWNGCPRRVVRPLSPDPCSPSMMLKTSCFRADGISMACKGSTVTGNT